MAISIGDAVLKLSLDATDLATGLANAGKGIQTFSQNFSKALGSLQAPLNKLSLNVTLLGGAIVGLATKSVMSFASMGSQLTNLSIKTGFSTEALSKLSYMAKLSDTSIEGLEVGIKTMQNRLYDASQGSKEAAASLKAIGLSIEDIQDLTPEQQFEAITNALAGLEDQNTRTRIATDLFGRSGTQLLPILAMGKEGMKAAGDEAGRLGLVMSNETAAAGDNLSAAFEKAKGSLEGLAIAIGKVLTPEVLKIIDGFTAVVGKVAEWIEQNPEMVKQIVLLGTKLLILGGILKGIALAMALVQAFSGPGGWIALGLAVAAFVGASLAIDNAMKKMETTPKVPSMQYGGIVPGPIGSPQPIIAHGGEEFLGMQHVSRTSGNNVVINLGVVPGDDTTIRKFARMLKDVLGEEGRRSAFGPVNQGYFYGRSSV